VISAIEIPAEKVLNPQVIPSITAENMLLNTEPLLTVENQVDEALIKDMEEIQNIANAIKILATGNEAVIKNANRLLEITTKYLNQTVEV
jgi:hypothetical protein